MTSKICRKYFSCATSCVQRCKNTCRLLGETWNTRKITFLNFLSGQSHPSLVNQFCGLMHISSLFSSFLSSFLSSFCPSPPLLYSFPCLFLPFFLSFLSSGYFSFFDFFFFSIIFLARSCSCHELLASRNVHFSCCSDWKCAFSLYMSR